MPSSPSASILCQGLSAWAFEPLANQLAGALAIKVSEEPAERNYLLASDRPEEVGSSFIPWESILLASDKRLLARRFASANTPTPETHLCETLKDARAIASQSRDRQWCVKYPTGTGASGHRIFSEDIELPGDWPTPIVLQEFVRLEKAEVFRLYCAGSQTFGWNVRRNDGSDSPWVAHARGALYHRCGLAPSDAVRAAESAFLATGLFGSFGCADLIRHPDKGWLVLEVGTDGVFNHVDRELGIVDLENEILERIADSFRRYADR